MQTLVREEILNRNWSTEQVLELFELPFCDLLLKAQTIHRENHQANAIQLSRLLSIKTGACPEDCAYCPQSSRYQTEIEQAPLMPLKQVIAAAKQAKANGAQRFCMGAAWRSPTEKQLDGVIEHVQAVKELGMEACVTLGMLKDGQAERLKEAGLDYYNHNIDTAPEYYRDIISTRTFQDRINTLNRVREAGLKVCCGGIVGMGESRTIRAGLLATLASLDPYPESVPINQLVKVTGTPLANADDIDPIEFVKTICVARIIMPKTVVRLSAGRESMSESTQALCFMAGASSIFMGEQLLTTPNPDMASDQALFNKLGLTASTERINEPFSAQSILEASEIA